jgi:hypothetical protein
MVINVPLLFHLSCDGATVMGALQQSRKRELMFLTAWTVGPIEYFLHGIESFAADNRRVGALVLFSAPEELAEVEPVLQQPVNVRFRNSYGKLIAQNSPELG